MSSSTNPQLGTPAKVSQKTFIGIAWGSVAVSALFFVFRILVRLKVFRRLHADDGLVLFAWIVLLISAVLWQTGVEALYENVAVSAGQLYPPPADFPRRTEQYLRKSVAVIVFFYTGLWSVKLSFLIFFKRLGHNVRHQNTVWWVVLGINVATYITCLGTIEYRCLASSFSYIFAHCAQAPGPIRFQRLTLRANMILDVITDALIILVPVNLLWKVRLSIRKKFALGGIFSITVIIMIFAIVRVVVVSSRSQQPDQTWLYMWSFIEQGVSILVACIASFPSLFKKSERDKHQRLPKGNSDGLSDANSRRGFFRTKRSKFSKEGLREVAMENVGTEQNATAIRRTVDISTSWNQHPKSSSDSIERILPASKAHVMV